MTYNAPPLLRCPLVLTVHDVSFRLYPEYFSPRVRILLSTLLSFSMRKAKAILTVSECSRRDILRFYPAAMGKVCVIPEAAGPVIWAKPDLPAARRVTGDRPFLLTVGTTQPRKNLPRLIEAYLQLREERVTDARLVIAGRPGWRTDALARLFANSDHRHDVIFTGYVADSILAALYRECALFVYPSLYEGFGLPVLEAMACGAPVITSNTSSLPEVAGDAARLVDPFSVQSIRAALEDVLRDRHLQEELRGLGKRRASEFSWERTARETLVVYERVAGE
jgi:glycosyltransferase involved in cell wall biosynthesis